MSDELFTRLQKALSPGFELERELTGGGMSRVFVATERALGRRVVIKVLPPELAAGVNTERFRREIQLAAQLHHPHIVPLLAAGEMDGLLYYTMPFIEGQSLRELLATRGRFPVREVVRIMHDVVDALAYAHARGIIHRDIKPGNILTLGSHALVTDFGVAKALSAALPISGVTTGGIAIGTPAYMAPEQLAGDPQADHRMDIYAAGLLAYELLAGASPFSGPSPQATMAAQLTRMPEPVEHLRDDVPPVLSRIITRCLRKSANERYSSAHEMLAELDSLEMPSGDTVTRRVAADAPAPRRSRLVAGAFLTIALVAAALAGMAANAVLSSREGTVVADTVGAGVQPPQALGETGAATAAATPQVAPPALTRAESLAIAREFQKQLGLESANNQTAEIPQEAMARLHKMVADSIRRAIEQMELTKLRVQGSAPGAPGTMQVPPMPSVPTTSHVMVRVVEGEHPVAVADLANATGRMEFSDLGRQFAESLRVAIDRHNRFAVIPHREKRSGSAGEEAAFTVGGMLMVSGGSLTHMLRVHDRAGRMVGVINGPLTPLDQPMLGMAELTAMTLRQLEELSKGDHIRGVHVLTSPSRTDRPRSRP